MENFYSKETFPHSLYGHGYDVLCFLVGCGKFWFENITEWK
jgi:hypothetical protein